MVLISISKCDSVMIRMYGETGGLNIGPMGITAPLPKGLDERLKVCKAAPAVVAGPIQEL